MSQSNSKGLGAYDNMERSSITPDFKSSITGNQKGLAKKMSRAAERASAEDRLASGEVVEDAASGFSSAYDSETSGFTNSVTGTAANEGKGKAKGAIKKGPLALLLSLLLGGGVLMVGSQSLMPFNLIANMTAMYDSAFTSRVARLPHITKWLFNIENDESSVVATRKRLFGDDYTKFRNKLTKNAANLESEGISVIKKGVDIPDDVTIPAGSKVRIRNGDEITIETDMNSSSLKNIYGDFSLKDDVLIRHTGTGDVLISSNKYGELYLDDADFRNSINRGTRSFTGRIAAWIDLSCARFLDNYDLTRSLFAGWINKVYDAEGEDTTFHDIINNRRTVAASVDSETRGRKTVTDSDGNSEEVPDEQRLRGNVDDAVDTSGLDTATLITNVAQASSSIACGVAAVAASVSLLKTAIMLDNARGYFGAVAEAVDKAKAGDGSESPIHDASRDLVEADESGKSAMEAEGIKLALSSGTYKPNLSEETLSSLNVETAFSTFGASIGMVIGCAAAKIISSGVSFVLSLFSFGTFSVGKTALSMGIAVAVAGIVSIGVSHIMENVKNNMCTDESGVKRGTCLALGGSNYMQSNFQVGGGSPGDSSTVASFYDAHQLALAQEAEYDRATKDWYDVTNQNTFLGSLVSKFATMGLSMTSFTGTINTVTSTTTSSLVALLPTASAISKTEYLKNQIGSCPNLESIGAVGDIYCNPILISDQSTVQSDPEDNMNKIANLGGFKIDSTTGKVQLDSNGVEEIDAKSNLGKYVLYCTNRQSPFGIVDQNIQNTEYALNNISGNSTVDTLVNSVLGATPFAGDVLDVVEAGANLAAMGWSTGANCVARSNGVTSVGGTSSYTGGGTSSSDSFYSSGASNWNINVISWDEMKLYQRYVEDDRLIQAADPEAKSAVVSFLESYEKENPVDNSLEGTLARQTGITKAQVAYTINEMQYWNYIASIDYDSAHKFVDEPAYETPVFDPSAPTDAYQTIADVRFSIIYNDIRNRSFAV